VRNRTVVAALGAATVLWGGAVISGSAATSPTRPAPTPIASRANSVEAWTARVLLPTTLRRGPSMRAAKYKKITPYAPYDQGPQVLLVLEARTSVRDGVWYKVRTSDRPLEDSGWLPESVVKVKKTKFRIQVDISDRELTLYRGGVIVDAWSVAVGTPDNPTPEGEFAISEIVPQTDPDGFFGPYIVTLTAHSAKLSDFDGGDGRVALHGTSLPNLLGTAASHGCIRLPNDLATQIAKTVPLGSPVDVVE
jgi:lipoprotein-anchoring transpeptidase ErfK/SrfK